MATAEELRAEQLDRTLQRMVEGLETIFVGVNSEMLKTLDFEAALLDFVKEWNRAPNDADTGEYPLPAGIAWPDDETTEPIGIHNRGNE